MDPSTISYQLHDLKQQSQQELHRDRIARVYNGEISDTETQRRARRRIDWISEQIPAGRILDIGCSEGILDILLAQKGCEIDAIDIHPDVLAYAQELAKETIAEQAGNIRFTQSDIFEFEKIEPEYDFVVLGEVIEHVFEPQNMLKRAALALRLGGRLIITTPFGYSPAPDHRQTYFLDNFLKIIPTVIRCEHLSITDQFICFVGRKIHDPIADADGIPHRLKFARGINTAYMLEITEAATFESQRFLRDAFENRSDLLKMAREAAEKLRDQRDSNNSVIIDLRGKLSKLQDDNANIFSDALQTLESRNTELKAENQELRRAEKDLTVAVRAIRKQAQTNVLTAVGQIEEMNRKIASLEAEKASGVDQSQVKPVRRGHASGRLDRKQDSADGIASGPSGALSAQMVDNTGFVKRTGRRLALRLAANPKLRASVRRYVPPGLKRSITGYLFSLPSEPDAIVTVRAPSTAVPSGNITSRTATKTEAQRYDAILNGVETYDSVLLCHGYPGGARDYGGGFIQSRAEAYRAQGLSVLVAEVSSHNGSSWANDVNGLDCLRLAPDQFAKDLRKLLPRTNTVLIHSPSGRFMDAMPRNHPPIIAWFHGFEVRDYRRLFFNFTTAELETRRAELDAVNAARFAVAREIFENMSIHKVFVSNYLQQIAVSDVGTRAQNAHIIPNFIDADHYEWRAKPQPLNRKILLIRSFAARNYANDIATEAIALLSSRPGFDALSFTICGFGKEFGKLTEPLRRFGNVTIREGVLDRDEMKTVHGAHGVFLAPTRFDTQGVSLGEAMSSGLACITNRTTGIPEFCDDESAVLVRPDDPQAFAEAIWETAHDPGKVDALSRNGAERVRRQCGFGNTIERELALIRAL